MKSNDLVINNQQTAIPLDIFLTEKEIFCYISLAEVATRELEIFIDTTATLDSLLEDIQVVAQQKILPSIDTLIASLIEKECYDFDGDNILKLLNTSPARSQWDEALQQITEQYLEITLNEEELNEHRTKRRKNRTKQSGYNVESSAKAGAVNMATNIAHGSFNLIAAGVSSASVSTKKKEIKESADTRALLSSSFYNLVEYLTTLHLQIFRSKNLKKLLTPEERNENIKIAQTRLNLCKLSVSNDDFDTAIKLALDAINHYPSYRKAYEELILLALKHDAKIDNILDIKVFSKQFDIDLQVFVQKVFSEQFEKTYYSNELSNDAVKATLTSIANKLDYDPTFFIKEAVIKGVYKKLAEVGDSWSKSTSNLEKSYDEMLSILSKVLFVGDFTVEDSIEYINANATETELKSIKKLAQDLNKTCLTGSSDIATYPMNALLNIIFSQLSLDEAKDTVKKTMQELEDGKITDVKLNKTAAFLITWADLFETDKVQVEAVLKKIEGEKNIAEIIEVLRHDFKGIDDNENLIKLESIVKKYNLKELPYYKDHVHALRDEDQQEHLLKLSGAIEKLVSDEKSKNISSNERCLDIIEFSVKYSNNDETLDSILKEVDVRRSKNCLDKIEGFRSDILELNDKIDSVGFIKKQGYKVMRFAKIKEYEVYVSDVKIPFSPIDI